jgi:NAD(P)-dependent dehydrogenase (short-subunit alcohol dehydrogenase family)
MRVEDKVVVVTGGASGIGKGLCLRFHQEGARGIAVADINEAGAREVAQQVGGLAMRCDVAVESDVVALVEETGRRFGPIDLFCSNAGIAVPDAPGGMATSAPNQDWQRIWEVNVMAHVYAARAVLPGMIERGGGYLLITSSAAGLLSQIGSAPYSVTKHAAIGFAESLAITHGDQGIRVSVLCPQGVATPMTAGQGDTPQAGDGMLQPSDVAETVVRDLNEERFLMLPHPQVLTYLQRKTSDYDRWLNGMRRFRRKFI